MVASPEWLTRGAVHERMAGTRIEAGLGGIDGRTQLSPRSAEGMIRRRGGTRR